MYWTPPSSSKQAQHLAIHNHLTIWRKPAVICLWYTIISFLFEIIRRLSAAFTPFYTPDVLKASFIVYPSSATRKMQSLYNFWRKQVVISFPFEIFQRLYAAFNPLYTPNVVHASFVTWIHIRDQATQAGWRPDVSTSLARTLNNLKYPPGVLEFS